MAYTGVSIVDYLNSIGQPSSYGSRAILAASKGIQNYAGTAEQNTQLLSLLRQPIQSQPVRQPIQPQPTQQPQPQPQPQTQPQIPAGELPYQTYERTTGKKWTGGLSPEVQSYYKQFGITAPASSAQANLALQQALVNQPTQTTTTQKKPATGQPEAITEQPTVQTQPKIGDTAASTGFDDIFAQFGISTQNTVEDMVKMVSKMYGFDDINTEMEKIDTQYADDVMGVNSNPWLSEGSRSKKISLLKDKYETKKNAMIKRLKLQGDIVGKAITLYQNEKDLQKDLLFKAIDMRQKEIDEHKAFELSAGQKRYEYNSTTGKYEVVASVAPKPEKTTTDEKALAYDEIKQKAAKIFEENRNQNQDKMISPEIYEQARNELKQLGLGSYLDDFDRAFRDLLSDESKGKFGISLKASNDKASSDIDAILNNFMKLQSPQTE